MPDEDKTVGKVALGTQAEPVVVAEPVVEPHPLEEGGVRFNEVYARMKVAEEREMQVRERLARVEGQLAAAAPAQPQAQAPKLYKDTELQQLVDTGRISPALMASQLAWQAKEEGKRELRQEFQVESRRSSAQAEVTQYLDKIPALANQSSPEFTKVARAAWEIGDEMGLPTTDPRVQRRALRETLGTLDKVVATAQIRDESRRNAGLSAEVGPGAGGQGGSGSKDPLKGIPARYLDFWKSKGYSKERMVAEAAYLSPKQRSG